MFGPRLQEATFSFLVILLLHFHGCFSLNFEGVSLLAFQSSVKMDMFDSCKWNGVQCVDGRVETLLLSENKFEGGTQSSMEKTNTNFQLKNNKNRPCDLPGEINCVNRKFGHCFWQRRLQNCKGGSPVIPSEGKFLDFFYVWIMSKLKNKYWHWHEDKSGTNLLTSSYISQPVHDFHMARRNLRVARPPLLQRAKNLPSSPVSSAPPHTVSVPSHGSGSFVAIPDSKGSKGRKAPPSAHHVSVEPHKLTKHDDKSAGRSWPKWIFTLIIPITVLILIIIMALIVVYQRNVTAIYAWKTGQSGPLQNAFITGVPKLSGAELEVACEEFTNILMIFPNYTVFKGILSNGVEIAVASTKATSQLDWSEKSDSQFRNKIDAISKLNHKNFVNLLGYCQEDDPFMRMMVFEFAPNGTLFENLHEKGLEHVDWSTRMRIIMGIAYCLQYMHDLKPAVVHPILHSNYIFLTEDYAAKIGNIGIFSEPLGKEYDSLKDYKDNSVEVHNSPESNVYSFGILLLEIISGRMPISEDDGIHILDWAMEHLKDKKSINSLVDPSLMSNNDNELQIICKVAEACTQEDPNCRPTMKEVSVSLKEVLGIEPEAAMSRLSPLWWAELEILSVEAS